MHLQRCWLWLLTLLFLQPPRPSRSVQNVAPLTTPSEMTSKPRDNSDSAFTTRSDFPRACNCVQRSGFPFPWGLRTSRVCFLHEWLHINFTQKQLRKRSGHLRNKQLLKERDCRPERPELQFLEAHWGTGVWDEAPSLGTKSSDQRPSLGLQLRLSAAEPSGRVLSDRTHATRRKGSGESAPTRTPSVTRATQDLGGPRTTRPLPKPRLTSGGGGKSSCTRKEVPGLNMAAGASAAAQPPSAPPHSRVLFPSLFAAPPSLGHAPK